MDQHQHRFLRLALDQGALRFGEFTLKSGRSSPYFFNAGAFDSGSALAALGDCYADAIEAAGLEFDMLFGPAYKGIPLATTVAMSLARRGRDVPLAFNRKEAKQHGEGGRLIGAPLKGRILIVDDVITAGTAIRESLALIADADASVAGVLVALDRQERGQGELSAVQELSQNAGVDVIAVANLDDLLAFSQGDADSVQHHQRLLAYRDAYGCAR
ncbi:MAG: orotate phosphoribosyltransferase [Lysobacteraceae bacterium]